MTKIFYQGAVGSLVVFDATERKTLEIARKWKQDIDSKVFFPYGTSDIVIPGTSRLSELCFSTNS
jgi:GTPase SAR1 family protein